MRVVGGAAMIELCDVGPRDGLQSEAAVVEPAVRASLCDRLLAAGLPLVEAVSFVRDERVPAMAAPEAVLEAVSAREADRARLAGLVLNARGYERLRATELRTVHVTFGATESFQERNGGSTVAEGLARALAVAALARADGRAVTAVVSCAFGCPYDGPVDPGQVVDLAAQAAAHVDAVVLADTIGVAVPREVSAAVHRLDGAVGRPGPRLGVHLHDTRGTGVAGALAALEAGATRLDAAVGGVGGCPFAPGAQGNVATEDLVYALEREGMSTGVDLDELVATARWLGVTLGRSLPGHVHRAGRWPVERAR
jgi:hydroxymethylglutaryl-CoA lyase/(R)-citramalyl-CoA lyase